MKNKLEKSTLREFANYQGVQTSFYDMLHKKRIATDDALLAVVKALDKNITHPKELPAALHKHKIENLQRKLEPVIVAWDGLLPPISLQLTPDENLAKIQCQLIGENGFILNWGVDLSKSAILNTITFNTITYLTKSIALKEKLPFGYHSLYIKFSNFQTETFIISAPSYVPLNNLSHQEYGFGLFVPLYALHSERSLGCGDLTDFKNFIDWAADCGSNLVSTLPLHATYLQELFEISPYSPASRLFWNELYLDITQIPEFSGEEVPSEVIRLNAAPIVHYKKVIQIKYKLLEKMLQKCLLNESRKAEFFDFIDKNPEVNHYAAFRANIHLTQSGWSQWVASERSGALPAQIKQNPHYFLHAYVQWQMHAQMQSLMTHAKTKKMMLYLDAPVGVHREGFDTWGYANEFPQNVCAGAPPDLGFIQGQNWGIAPLHPQGIRKQNYRYFIQCLKTIMPLIDILRLDHVMGLHRLYWVPDGFPTDQGVYIHYPAEELYAILCLESSRHQVMLIGENLGTVPQYVNKTIKNHHFLSMHVLQYEIDMKNYFSAKIPKQTIASLNTHDMPPFAGYFKGLDIQQKLSLNLLNQQEFNNEMQLREKNLEKLESTLLHEGFLPHKCLESNQYPENKYSNKLKNIFYGSLFFLAASPARYLLINLEDLWLESCGQNTPSVSSEKSKSWQRKTKHQLEEIQKNDEFKSFLKEVKKIRPSIYAKKRKKNQLNPSEMKIPILKMQHDFSLLSAEDIYLFNEGRHFCLYEKLGAHYMSDQGRIGVSFAVWAPNAQYVSVVGDFNEWCQSAHPLKARDSSGIWEGFISNLQPQELYKYFIDSHYNNYQVIKTDPFAFYNEVPPQTASIIYATEYPWQDQNWMESRHNKGSIHAPISIYEVHLGSWRRVPEDNNRFLNYREVAPLLAEYIKQQGYTHVEFMPLMEHPYYESWGYQTTGYFAPTSRYGAPEDFKYLIDYLHQQQIGVILDWVPSHFPCDEHGLAYFDGTHLYEHADPRQGFHPDWTSSIFNYGRKEVCSFLISSALFWLDQYHIDGLRVDAVASMLYLDYSRKENEWLPNPFGGRENLEAIHFIKQLNEEIYNHYPDVQTFAEESTAWGGVSHPTYLGGLGFGYKWDMGWMHDTLKYLSYDPIYRSHHHNQLSFRMIYAFHENFLLPLSHDEVVHGKGSILRKMPGYDWDKFANMRLLFGYMFAQPGKKLLFMGNDLAVWDEWKVNQSLDWHLLEFEPHQNIQKWIQLLNNIYRNEPALYQYDCDSKGFEWIDCSDSSHSTIAFLRNSDDPADTIMIILNATPMRWENYRVGVPYLGQWRVIANSDELTFGGTHTHLGEIFTEEIPFHNRAYSININIPPLTIIFLKR